MLTRLERVSARTRVSKERSAPTESTGTVPDRLSKAGCCLSSGKRLRAPCRPSPPALVAAAALAEGETPTPAARLVASETQCRLPPRPQPWTQSQRGALKSAWGSARSREATTYRCWGGEALRLVERWSDAGAGRVAAVASAATTTAVRVHGAREPTGLLRWCASPWRRTRGRRAASCVRR
jgi:hypothetical protein